MKKSFILAALMLALGATMAYAQPRAIGGRLGYNFDVSYQHNIGRNFLEIDAGLELWGLEGMHAGAIYDWVLAQPNWTPKGEWTWYAGAGLRTGIRWWDNHRVYDKSNHSIYHDSGNIKALNDPEFTDDGLVIFYPHTSSFNIGVMGQIGLEYKFWFPLALSVDYRPYFGLAMGKYAGRYYHVSSDGYHVTNGVRFDSGGFWGGWAGVFGDIALSVRYAF